MTLPNERKLPPYDLQELERRKFGQDDDGQVIVQTSGKGTFSVNGLKLGGKITALSINSTTWTAINATPLANANQINIQNESGQLVKLNYIEALTFEGVYLKDGMERQYSISGAITIYARCESGTAEIIVEELA